MEPEVSLPSSQEPATGPCPEPDNPVHILIPYFFNVHFITDLYLQQMNIKVSEGCKVAKNVFRFAKWEPIPRARFTHRPDDGGSKHL
jgi:hypothetical protein